MTVFVNGKEVEVNSNVSLLTLVDGYRLNADTIVLEHNNSIIKKDLWGITILHSGDKVEIVTFVGGGD